jgi:hypothetical protein
MARLIDAKNAWKVAQRIYSDEVLLHAIKNVLDSTESEDAVEVVRCNDCKHCVHLSKRYKCDIGCEKLHTDSIYLDFYCRYGERKDND